MTDIREAVTQIKAAGSSKPRAARDPVNQPMINNWVEAIGDRNPIYVDDDAARAVGHPGIVAPPAMIQVWTMYGLGGQRPKDDPLGPVMKLFDDAGYIGVVATNCEQIYHRYLRPGEQVTITAELGDVVGPKQTALGEGWFVNQHTVWRVGDEDVAEMDWRILKFRPATTPGVAVPDDLDPDAMMRPSLSRDTAFFGKVLRLTSCASNDGPTARCSIRRFRRCGRSLPRRSITQCPAVAAWCSASWCTTHPRCQAA
ncbi:hypothetical protein NIIDMKKI_03310 [Mycobacterium kansasii]|uniref:FAS1-like dehydratase domain-containing protein n=1 Tax=Mycobacterium kansasii TaxID=1768 RepID=A0A7G1I5G6_MYCKA|nr:hypothetical protein NIIDMKKI_03310 [Mycobacterium kansasii]